MTDDAPCPDAALRPGTLGAAVRARRLELGWSQEDLAERMAALGDWVGQPGISRIERGTVGYPRVRRLEALAEALALPVGELLARSGWTDPDRDP